MLEWRKVLKPWSDAIIASGEYSHVLVAVSKKKWAGFRPASDVAIARTERRLERRLPESYRQFLKVSNGWWLDGTAGPTRLWRVEEIRLMADADPEAVVIWSTVGPDGDPTGLPSSHYPSVIQISDDNDGRYLLNPLVKRRDEWQAAFLAPWVPGAQCYESFEFLMKAKFEAFLAAHPPTGKRRSSARSLARPPSRFIGDRQEFVNELGKLGFFDFVSPQTRAAIVRDFLDVSKSFAANNGQLLKGKYASPGAVLCDPRSGRVVNLDIARLAKERGRYAIRSVRPLLASARIEIGKIKEQIATDSYGITLEGVHHEYFGLRKGCPSLPGGEHKINAARYVLYETCKLLNKVLKQKKNVARVATLEEHRDMSPMRLAFVLLDDELSHLFMWSQAVHNYCRPMRPDVFG
jgi:SMI1 / KNR4 family (SUKH-1)